MGPGIPGGWIRREFWRRVRLWSLAGLVVGAVAAVLSGRWWAMLAAVVVPFAYGPLRREVLGAVVPRAAAKEGRDAVAEGLAALSDHGYRTVQDSAAAPDASVVLGPTGVFVLAARAFAGDVHVRGRRLTARGRGSHDALEGVRAAANSVELAARTAVPGVRVAAILVATAGRLGRGPVLLSGVAVLPATDLVSYVLGGRTLLTPADVTRIHAALLRDGGPIQVRPISFDD